MLKHISLVGSCGRQDLLLFFLTTQPSAPPPLWWLLIFFLSVWTVRDEIQWTLDCVWCRISHSAWLTPASGRAWAYAPVVDAEGLDEGAVGEERTEGKRTNGTFKNDIKE